MQSGTLNGVLKRFLAHEACGGLILMTSAAIALILANSAFEEDYFHLLHLDVGGVSLLHGINDGLMTFFFLLVGLEIKRELVGGHLSAWKARALPGMAALGGMVVPALMFVGIATWTRADAEVFRGWAIPSATDIAFSLGVLSLLGRRVPISLKIFLTALAILDDLGAVLIIALFYAAEISIVALVAASAVFTALGLVNRAKVVVLWPYLSLGALLWCCLLYSGIHATFAGVLLAVAIPLTGGRATHHSPLHYLENILQKPVAFFILPIFGLANAGVSLGEVNSSTFLNPVTIACAMALFLGKQIGVFGGAWFAIRSGAAQRPEGASWPQLYGVAIMCGIGFTMSIFIALLAFAGVPEQESGAKLGVLVGSLFSGVVAWIVLRCCASPSSHRTV